VIDTNVTFAAWLRAARKEAGLSQQKVADALKAEGFAVLGRQSAIAKIERCERPIRLDEAAAFVALFGTTLDVALGILVDTPGSFASRQLVARTSLLTQIRSVIDAELGGA
jgi:transcriptional regulator with XRE-family HTH domain